MSSRQSPPPYGERSQVSERRGRFEAEYTARVTKNELSIGRVGVAVALAGALASVHITLVLHRGLGLTLLAMALVYAAYAGLLAPRLLRREAWLVWVQRLSVSVEVSIPVMISLVDLVYLGGRYAFTSTPVFFVFLAVIAAGIRWRPWLALYAGALGGLEQGLLYLLYLPDITPAHVEALPSLSAAHAMQRSVYLLLAGVLAAVAAQVGRRIAERVVEQLIEQERVRRLFGEYVSSKAVDEVLSGDLALAGERREVTVLFADIRSFTTLSASLEPEQVVAFLNRYFAAVSQVISVEGGMVNKFMGDGLLAVFGAPEPQPDHARRAMRAAWAMVAAAATVKQPDGQPTAIGVGLHTGALVLGSIGSPHHRDYTVIGDTVNVASRVEGLTRELGECVLLTEETRAAAGEGTEVDGLGERQVKGREAAVKLFALRAAPDVS